MNRTRRGCGGIGSPQLAFCPRSAARKAAAAAPPRSNASDEVSPMSLSCPDSRFIPSTRYSFSRRPPMPTLGAELPTAYETHVQCARAAARVDSGDTRTCRLCRVRISPPRLPPSEGVAHERLLLVSFPTACRRVRLHVFLLLDQRQRQARLSHSASPPVARTAPLITSWVGVTVQRPRRALSPPRRQQYPARLSPAFHITHALPGTDFGPKHQSPTYHR